MTDPANTLSEANKPYIYYFLYSMRPRQWVKNLFVLAPLVFGKEVFIFPQNARALLAFAVFCLVSGAVYVINDIADREGDRRHPDKSQRPIALGVLPFQTAFLGASSILVVSLGLAFMLEWKFSGILFAYILLNIGYSYLLKHIVLVDVFVVALGFVFRVAAGGIVIDVQASSWLLLCTLLIALFLALCKRRHELVLLEEGAKEHRKILREYNPYFLDQLIAVVTASTVVAYALYTMSEEVQAFVGNAYMQYTIPFVLYGIFRYLYLVHRQDIGSPTEIMLGDVPMIVNIGLWGIAVLVIFYFL